MSKDIDAAAILDLPMQENDAGVTTVREYLVALAREVWSEGEGFSGKRPFGNSGWESEVYTALAKNGVMEATQNNYGELEWTNEEEHRASGLIQGAFAALEARPVPVGLIQEWTPPGLTAEQEIRARAMDSAAHVFGPVCAAMAVPTWTGYSAQEVLNMVTEAWLTAGIVAAHYIDSPAEPTPSQDATGAAEGEA